MSHSKFNGSLIWIGLLFFGLLSCGDFNKKPVKPASTLTTIKSLSCANGAVRVSKKNVSGSSSQTIQPGQTVSINGSTNRMQNPCLNNSSFSFHCEGTAYHESSFSCQSGYITLTNPVAAASPAASTSIYPQMYHSLHPRPSNRVNIHNAQIHTWGDYKKFAVTLVFSHYTFPQMSCRLTYGCY